MSCVWPEIQSLPCGQPNFKRFVRSTLVLLIEIAEVGGNQIATQRINLPLAGEADGTTGNKIDVTRPDAF